MSIIPITIPPKTLAQSITSASSSFQVSDILKWDGSTNLAASDLGTQHFVAFVNATRTRIELMEIDPTTIASSSITILKRGLDFNGDETEVSAYKLDWSANETTVLFGTDVPQLLNNYIDKSRNQTITGYKIVPTPISDYHIATKKYVDDNVNGGTVSVDRVVEVGIAGETLVDGNLVYLKAADGRWWKCDADDTTTIDNVQLGIAQGAGTAGNSISGGVLRRGVDNAQSGGAAGSIGYASNTGGGISTSAGTYERAVGQFYSATEFYFDPFFYYTPTARYKAASAGSQGVPSSTNKYVTQDNTSNDSTDQTQTTQNATTEVGEADATTKKNKIAQSFVPTKTKIRSVFLYKIASSGIFTGTVTVALQADSSGNPSGSDLATKTFTNTEWEAKDAGEVEAIFSSEYTSLVAGSTYWIVISSSTSDNTNHPNFGSNSAGGYSSGSLKYNNTTDGWVAISGYDLYFKTSEGITSQVVKTNSSGKIESDFYDLTEMPLPAFNQKISFNTNSDSGASTAVRSTSNQSGSVLIIVEVSGGSGGNIIRLARDSVTGQYFPTHVFSGTGSSTTKMGVVVLGNYVYYFYDNGATMACRRVDLADLTNETAMTIGTAIDTSGAAPVNVNAFTDGKYIYVQENGGTTFHKLSVSGTTLTQVSTITVDSAFDNNDSCFFFDGEKIVMVECIGVGPTGNYRMTRFTDPTATPTLTTFGIGTMAKDSIGSSGTRAPVVANIDSTRMYVGQVHLVYDNATDQRVGFSIFPISKPA